MGMVLRESLLHFCALLNGLMIGFPKPSNLTLRLLQLSLLPLHFLLLLLALSFPLDPCNLIFPCTFYTFSINSILTNLGCEVLDNLHELNFLAFHGLTF